MSHPLSKLRDQIARDSFARIPIYSHNLFRSSNDSVNKQRKIKLKLFIKSFLNGLIFSYYILVITEKRERYISKIPNKFFISSFDISSFFIYCDHKNFEVAQPIEKITLILHSSTIDISVCLHWS